MYDSSSVIWLSDDASAFGLQIAPFDRLLGRTDLHHCQTSSCLVATTVDSWFHYSRQLRSSILEHNQYHLLINSQWYFFGAFFIAQICLKFVIFHFGMICVESIQWLWYRPLFGHIDCHTCVERFHLSSTHVGIVHPMIGRFQAQPWSMIIELAVSDACSFQCPCSCWL